MHLRLRLALLATLALTALAGTPTPAFGAEHVIRPVQTYATGQWSVVPSSSLAHAALADPVAAPAAPDVGSGYMAAHGNGPITGEVGLAAPALALDETITGARLHAYLGTGSARSLAVEFRSGSTLLGLTWVPAGQPAGWRTINAFSVPTAAQLSDLRMRVTVQGSGSSTDVKVYAAYGVVAADSPSATTGDTTLDGDGDDTPTDDHDGSTGTGGDGSTPEAGDAGGDATASTSVALPVQSLRLAANGVLAVPLTCRLAAGCTGTVSVRLVRSSAASARRRKASRGRKSRKTRFRLAPGESKRIRLRLDRRTSRVVRRRGRAKVAVTIAVDGAPPVTKQVTVRYRRGGRRRR